MRASFVVGGAALAWLVGCATPRSPDVHPAAARACLDGRAPVGSFQVEGSRTLSVVSAGRAYVLTLAADCPGLARATSLGFTTGVPVLLGIGRSTGPVWATTLDSPARICGRGSDRVAWREGWEGIDRPPRTCPIATVERR